MPQPFGFVTLPVPAPAQYYPVPFPLMPPAIFGLAKSSPMQAPKACCPACASAHCNGCGADSPCQATACVAAGCASVQVRAPQKTLEDRLIRLIVSTVKPESWDVNGGRGTIDYFPLGMALAVNQTAEVQEQISHLLAGLRRLQDEQIAVEVRVINVPKGFGDKVADKCAHCCDHCASSCGGHKVQKTHHGSISIGASFSSDAGLTGSISAEESSAADECCSKDDACCKGSAKLTFLSDAQVQKFMDGLQSNSKTNVMMAPKLTVFNGQAANINVSEQQFFVTNVKMIRHEGQPVFLPENHPYSTGFRFSVKPTISTDHKFIQMGFEVEETTLQNAQQNVPLYPITTFIKPLFEGGAQGEPVPFTMFLQQPCLITQRVHQEVCVPCGRTALLKAWTRCTEVGEESQVPILSCLPYVGDMFKAVSYHEETADVWIMITPRVLISQKEENSPPVAAASPTVTDNLQKLQQARVLLDQADHCRRMGQPESARHIYERVRELCPGSRYAQMASRRMKLLQSAPNAEAPAKYVEQPGGFCYLGQSLVSKNHTDQKVDALLERYLEACTQGRLSEATQWAVQALALDPACFGKARAASWKKNPQPAVMPSAN
jgi:Flp pilus assembly secretin CpaC